MKLSAGKSVEKKVLKNLQRKEPIIEEASGPE